MKKIIEYVKHPSYILLGLDRMKLIKLNDAFYLKIIYYQTFNKKLDLSNPKTFNEKLQWLKLYDRNPEYTKMVDKYEVKKYVAEKIGEEYIIPTIGIYDSFEEINFKELPDQFVIKCTHDSGGIVICKDKSNFNIEETRKKINKCMKNNYYRNWREWPYKNVKPRIIIEKYMEDKNKELNDYKFFCFDGVADNVMVCLDRKLGKPKFYFFDKDWRLLRINKRGVSAPQNFTISRPDNLDKMFQIANQLSKNIPFSRIDLYNIDGKIYFGEITFYPQSGFDNNLLEKTDIEFGKKIKL